jgi:hypothetical protein
LVKLCTYCSSEIGLARRWRGELFCSSDHGELYRREQTQKAFDRVLNLSAPAEAHASRSAGVAAPATPRTSIRLRTVCAIAGGIAIVVLGALLFGPSSRKVQPSVSASVGSKPAPAAITIATKARPQPPVLAKVSHPLPAGGKSNVADESNGARKSHASIQATGPSWVVVCADGKVLFAKLFTAGSRDSVDFTGTAIVRTGSAGSLQIDLNGKPVGTLGAVGQVRIIELTPGDSHFREGGEADDCTKGR